MLMKEPPVTRKVTLKLKNRILLTSVVVLICAIVAGTLTLTNLIKGGEGVQAGEIKSMIILPFNNFTGKDSLDWFVSGMHSSLIQEFQKVGSLHIPGITTSKVFKDSRKTIKEITSELKVDAALETAVLCLGKDSICFQTRLFKSGSKEIQLWTDDYKIARNGILNWYTHVTKQIAEEMKVELTSDQESMLSKARLVDIETYNAFLQSRMYWDDLSKEGLEKAIDYLNVSIEKDPTWAPPYSGLAKVWMGLAQFGYVKPDIAGPKIFENLQKAMELDPSLPDLHFTLALIAALNEWAWEKAEKEFLQALAINPNDAISRVFYAHLLMFLRRNDEALSQAQRAVTLDPLNSQVLGLRAVLLGLTGNFEASLERMERTLEIDPGNIFMYSNLDIIAFYCKEYDKAINSVQYFMPFKDEIKKNIQNIYDRQGIIPAHELILQELENLNLQNNFPLTTYDMSVRYIMIGKYDKAVEWIETGYKIHDPNQPYIYSDLIMVDEIATNSKVIDILIKMNLPLPKSD